MAGQDRFGTDKGTAEIDVLSVTPLSIKLSRQGILTNENRNSAVWMAVVTVVTLVLASLTITSQGPLPYVHAYQVHVAPSWS